MVLSITACADQAQEFDTRLREMAGSDERHLLGSMGRIADNTYQLNADTRILQWRWDTSYISPGMAPTYVGGGWGWAYPGFGWGRSVGADRRHPAVTGAPGLHRRMDSGRRFNTVLSLARPRLRIGDHPQHGTTGLTVR
jgi:hypothetical protein